MLNVLQYVLYFLIILTSGSSVYFSVKYRRQTNAVLRGLYAARMNICMGLMLIVLAVIQLFFFPGSNTRIILGTLFLLLGLFNLFAGIRNHSFFSAKADQ